MNSADNRQGLARASGKYLLGTRMASLSEINLYVLSKRGGYTVFKENLRGKEVIIEADERQKRYILCYNPKEAGRQRRHREQAPKQDAEREKRNVAGTCYRFVPSLARPRLLMGSLFFFHAESEYIMQGFFIQMGQELCVGK
nr:hypothetical protein [Desulfobacterales bacterium]